MAKAIWKYPLGIGKNMMDMPAGTHILSALNQGEQIVLYALVDPSKPMVQREIGVAGTGWELSDDWDPAGFVGTVSTADGSFVWHVFARMAG